MNRHVVGHQEVKQGLLLGLLAREHIYIEGPPGIAKTMLSETVSRACDLQFYFYQFHRDTRLSEMVGDVVIHRHTDPEVGEVIAQNIRKGGVLTAELCVLDDISRAPGEALNVLLRILNERTFQQESIPLLCAIATSNPTLDDYYNEPLDPANLDRFTIQLRSTGLIQEKRWKEVRQLIDRYAGNGSEQAEVKSILQRKDFDRAHQILGRVEIEESVKRALISLLQRLLDEVSSHDVSHLLTDRSFLVKAVKLMKAAALLEGRLRVEPKELQTLRFLTAFRLPEEVQPRLPVLIKEVLAE